MSDNAVKIEGADEVYDGRLARTLADNQKILVLTNARKVHFIHCGLLGTSVAEIPGIKAHPLGYEMNLNHWDPRPVGHYVRSMYAIAHGRAVPEWLHAGDYVHKQLLHISTLPDLVLLLDQLRSPYKDIIRKATLSDCARFIRNDLSLQWSSSMVNGVNAELMTGVDEAWTEWARSNLPDDDTDIMQEALAEKVARTCPLAILQNLSGDINEHFLEAVLDELNKLVKALE